MFAIHSRRITCSVALALLLPALLPRARCALAGADDEADDAGRARRLENMKRSAAHYTIYPAADREDALEFVDTPCMRWTNPVNSA
jgi:hypothetical protein